jgi:hypothetical protein
MSMANPPSIARAVLEHFGFSVEDIPTAEREGLQQADYLVRKGDVTVLLEEKTKEESVGMAAERHATHASGDVHAETFPFRSDAVLSGVIRKASDQLRSSSRYPHDFRMMWFSATGATAAGKYEQFMAALYGRTNIVELGACEYRRCYFYRDSAFFRRRDVLDGAVAACVVGSSVIVRVCLNPLSARYAALRQSALMQPFGSSVEDPLDAEARGTAFFLDADLDRRNEGPLLEYLQKKYATGPLQAIDLGYTRLSVGADW